MADCLKQDFIQATWDCTYLTFGGRHMCNECLNVNPHERPVDKAIVTTCMDNNQAYLNPCSSPWDRIRPYCD
jgi:hypothetical protein